MPTYEYLCSKCEKTFETFQSMKDKHLTKCPDKTCKGRVKRLLGTGAGLIFKGSGFYITDYRSEGYKSAAKSDAAPPATPAASPSSEGSSAPKPDPKPAAKPTAEPKSTAKTKKESS